MDDQLTYDDWIEALAWRYINQRQPLSQIARTVLFGELQRIVDSRPIETTLKPLNTKPSS